LTSHSEGISESWYNKYQVFLKESLISDAWLIAIALLLLLVVGLVGAFWQSRLLFPLYVTYSLNDEGIVAIYFRSAAKRIVKYSEIAEIKVLKFWDIMLLLRSFTLINRYDQPYVYIRKRGRSFGLLISPDDPHSFVAAVNYRLTHTKVGAQ
jgi:hypothetical protein